MKLRLIENLLEILISCRVMFFFIIYSVRFDSYQGHLAPKGLFFSRFVRITQYLIDSLLVYTSQGWLSSGCFSLLYFSLSLTLSMPSIYFGSYVYVDRFDVIVLSSYLNIILDHHHHYYSHSFFSGLLVFSWLFICFLIHLFRQIYIKKSS